jgi:hypothetical protein
MMARPERHRVRKLLITTAGARQWVKEAQAELDTWLAGLPPDVIASVMREAAEHGTEIQRLVQAALDERATPSVLASRVYNLVVDRQRSARAGKPACATCGCHALRHGVSMPWCYECRRECRYQPPAPATEPAAVPAPDYAQW